MNLSNIRSEGRKTTEGPRKSFRFQLPCLVHGLIMSWEGFDSDQRLQSPIALLLLPNGPFSLLLHLSNSKPLSIVAKGLQVSHPLGKGGSALSKLSRLILPLTPRALPVPLPFVPLVPAVPDLALPGPVPALTPYPLSALSGFR